MLQEMMFYMECLKEKDIAHRKIHNRMFSRFDTSPAAVKDALLREKYIKLDYKKREAKTNKWAHYYKLTGKKLDFVETPVKNNKHVWPDGTPKSTNNAFDWMNTTKSMFDNREIARMNQDYSKNNPITVYSRA